MLVRPPMTNLKMTVRADCAVFAWGPLLFSIKALAHWLPVGVGESAFGQTSATLPLQLSTSEMKQTFLSTNLACLLAFEQQAARPHTLLSATLSGNVTSRRRINLSPHPASGPSRTSHRCPPEWMFSCFLRVDHGEHMKDPVGSRKSRAVLL